MHIIVWKTQSKISGSCEENTNQIGPSIPTNFSMIVGYLTYIWIDFIGGIEHI